MSNKENIVYYDVQHVNNGSLTRLQTSSYTWHGEQGAMERGQERQCNPSHPALPTPSVLYALYEIIKRQLGMSQDHIDVKCNTNLFSNFPVLANLIASLICLSKSHHCHEIIIIKKLNKRGDAKISENSNCCSYSVIVWVSVVLKRTVVGD